MREATPSHPPNWLIGAQNISVCRQIIFLAGPLKKYSTTEQKEAPALSAKIKDRMDQLQLNPSDLITKSEIPEDSFEDIMTGTVIPGIDVTGRLSKALDTSIDYLVGNSEYSCAIASEDEQDIILRYRQLSKKGKRIFWE